MRGVVRARVGDDGGAVADGVDRCREELELLPVLKRRRLAGRAGDDEAVGAVVHQVDRQPAEGVHVE